MPVDHRSRPLSLDDVQREMQQVSTGPWRSEDWINAGDSWSSLVSARQYRGLFDLINAYVPAKARVQDWGSGAGRTSYALLSAGHWVDAYDFVEPPQIDLLRRVGEERFRFTLATQPLDLPYADDTFDAVTSVGVLEHVRDTGGDEARSLAEIRRVLAPGGVFVCCHFPNRHSWIDALARRRPDMFSHDFRYTRSEIEALLDASGLALLEVHRYGALPRNRASRLPERMRDTVRGANAFDHIDSGLSRVLAPVCQNWAFVARKPTS